MRHLSARHARLLDLGVHGGSDDDPDDVDPKDDLKGDPKDDETFDEERAKAKIAKANSEAAGLRKRLKEAEEKAGKYDELQNEGKSEAEKLTSERDSAKSEASKAKLDAARFRVALDKGLTASQAKRLVGENEEELTADADELLKDLGSGDAKEGDTKDDGPGGRKPTEALKGGGNPDAGADDIDPAKAVERIGRAN